MKNPASLGTGQLNLNMFPYGEKTTTKTWLGMSPMRERVRVVVPYLSTRLGMSPMRERVGVVVSYLSTVLGWK